MGFLPPSLPLFFPSFFLVLFFSQLSRLALNYQSFCQPASAGGWLVFLGSSSPLTPARSPACPPLPPMTSSHEKVTVDPRAKNNLTESLATANRPNTSIANPSSDLLEAIALASTLLLTLCFHTLVAGGHFWKEADSISK